FLLLFGVLLVFSSYTNQYFKSLSTSRSFSFNENKYTLHVEARKIGFFNQVSSLLVCPSETKVSMIYDYQNFEFVVYKENGEEKWFPARSGCIFFIDESGHVICVEKLANIGINEKTFFDFSKEINKTNPDLHGVIALLKIYMTQCPDVVVTHISPALKLPDSDPTSGGEPSENRMVPH
ncbi:MAG: hypothetical protein ACRC2T_06280, partial [Thermoguttaceae bacterium]